MMLCPPAVLGGVGGLKPTWLLGLFRSCKQAVLSHADVADMRMYITEQKSWGEGGGEARLKPTWLLGLFRSCKQAVTSQC